MAVVMEDFKIMMPLDGCGSNVCGISDMCYRLKQDFWLMEEGRWRIAVVMEDIEIMMPLDGCESNVVGISDRICDRLRQDFWLMMEE